MKLLLDQNLSFRFLDQLSARFPGLTRTRIADLDRASDLQSLTPCEVIINKTPVAIQT